MRIGHEVFFSPTSISAMTQTDFPLVNDLAPTSKRPHSKAATTGAVRVTVTIEIPAGQTPPPWLVDFLRSADGAPKRPAPPGVESVAGWIARNVRLRPGSKLTLAAAFAAYHSAILAAGGVPESRNHFSAAAVRAVRQSLGLHPSNDLREAGKVRRGWRGASLAPSAAAPGASPVSYSFRRRRRRGQGEHLVQP